jgi:hypothetical protein
MERVAVSTRRMGVRARLAAVATATVLAALPLHSASAAESPPTTTTTTSTTTSTTTTTPALPPGIRLTSQRIDVVQGAYRSHPGMALWLKGRIGYQFTEAPDDPVPSGIAAVSLDTGKELFRKPLSRNAHSRPIDEITAVDEEHGVLYVARHGFQFTECATNQCFSGFHVLDARTLEPTGPGQINLSIVADDGTATSPKLMSMHFAPARFAGDRPKLLVSYIEGTNDDFSGAKYPTGLSYLAQFDVETGARDFAFRLGTCNGDRSTSIDSRAIRGAMFRVRRPGPPVIYVGCMSSSRSGQVVRVTIDETAPSASLQENFPGPLEVTAVIADPTSERILMKSGSEAMQWWVFDGPRSTFTGVVGIGSDASNTSPGFDTTTGRLYSLAPDPKGGLFVADIRRTPVPGATPFREFASLAGTAHAVIGVDPAVPGRARRLYVRATPYETSDHYKVLEDTIPISTNIARTIDPNRTRDVDEDVTRTRATYEGSARGFGLRSILVGGVEAIPRNSFNDLAILFRTTILTPFGTCGPREREIILGDAGRAVLSESGSRGRAQTVVTDQTTTDDAGRPITRCSPTTAATQEVRSPDEVNAVEDDLLDATTGKDSDGDGDIDDDDDNTSPFDRFAGVDCIAPDPDPARGVGRRDDPDVEGVFAETRCGERASATSQLEIADVAGIKVGHVSTDLDVFRDPKRGIVSRVTATTKAVQLPGGVTIDAVTTTAESWANGRKQPAALEPGQEVTDPNCDLTRTAGTCLRRTLQGVRAGSFSCSQCDANEPAFISAMNRALGREWQFRVRQPDERLAAGAVDGYNAGLQKPFDEEFADLSLNGDSLLTIPAFEMVRTVDSQFGRGRQIFQFAGVELATTYSVELLPFEVAPDPAALTVRLLDDESRQPLAGGAFRVHADRDGDGVIGLLDEVVDGGTCVTTGDGTGDCDFSDLEPGTYVVQQTAAPSGYALAPDRDLFLAPEEHATATFTNVPAIGSVEIELTDDGAPPVPLAGATFEVHADDGDGVLSAGDRLYDSCTTGADGRCELAAVPLGDYVLREATPPDDHLAVDDTAFALTAPGQVAKIAVVNGLTGIAGSAGTDATGAAGSEEVVDEEIDGVPGTDDVVVVIEDGAPLPVAEITTEPIAAHGPGPSVLRRLLDVPRSLSRYLARHPFEALLFAAVWGLFGAGAVLVARRRRFLAVVTAGAAPFGAPPRT